MTIWTSDLDDVPTDGTLPDLLETAAHRHPDRTALVDGPSGASVDHRELLRRIDRLSAWLHEDGFGPGDVLAHGLPNVPPVAAFTFAALRLGGAVTGANPLSPADDVARQVGACGASVVVTLPELATAAGAMPGVRRVVVMGADAPTTAAGAVTLGQVLRTEAPSAPVPARLTGATTALLPSSSGTTGLPKQVVLDHRSLVAVVRQLTAALGVDHEDVTLAVAPFFHILGATVELLVPLANGATVVTMPRFDPQELLRLLEVHRVTYLAVPPPIASFLAAHPAVDGCDLSALRLLAVGGAPLAPEVQERLAQRLPHCTVGQGWGLTETSGAVCVPRRGRGTRPGTVGRLLPNTALRVVDLDTGDDLPPGGGDGELLVRGPQTMVGYLGRPDDTAAMVDDDGWLRTGDVGHVDDDGEVVLVGRCKELIKVNAFQVAPAELEALLCTHPAVADAAVVGVPDERTGEAPVAFVVAAAGATVDPDGLRDWVGERVAPYKRLARVDVVDAVPRNAAGKIVRRLLPAVV
jgi:acyl-CoA synthetase (AMP-forming)/AMP-acid ligase II